MLERNKHIKKSSQMTPLNRKQKAMSAVSGEVDRVHRLGILGGWLGGFIGFSIGLYMSIVLQRSGLVAD